MKNSTLMADKDFTDSPKIVASVLSFLLLVSYFFLFLIKYLFRSESTLKICILVLFLELFGEEKLLRLHKSFISPNNVKGRDKFLQREGLIYGLSLSKEGFTLQVSENYLCKGVFTYEIKGVKN